MRKRAAVLLLVVARCLRAEATLDDVAARTLKEFDVPGLAVGVILDGKVSVSKGFGVRKAGESAAVTEKTLFQIASNTKAFTSAALAILVDEKKIDWDERVIDVLPNFQMSDAYVSREMRIRDLLCHRSGLALGAGDLLLFPDATLTVAEFIEHLRFVPLATSFRSHYAYDNVLYTVAGEVVARASGQPWSQFIQEKIFAPLGMMRSRTDARDIPAGEDVASAHAKDGEKLVVYPPAELGPAAPAGSINSSVEDLLKWANAQLHEGVYAGGRLFSAQQSQEMWTPAINVPIPISYPKELTALRPNFEAYALGWVVYDYHGERIVYHTGGLGGMVTRVTLIPSKKLGIVVLTNQEAGGAFQAVTMHLLDHYLGLPTTDWVAAFGAVAKQKAAEAKQTVAKAASHRYEASKPSLPLASYAGRYRDAWYGDVTISQENGNLVMRFSHSPRLVGKLEHFQYDTFIVRWQSRALDADAYVTFALNPDASIRQVRMAAVSPDTDFSFDFHDLDLKPIAHDAKAF